MDQPCVRRDINDTELNAAAAAECLYILVWITAIHGKMCLQAA